MSKSIFYKTLKTPKATRLNIDKIVYDLEYKGYSTNNTGSATQCLSRKLKHYRKQGDIIFAKDNLTKRTIVTMNPTKKLVRVGKARIKIIDKYNLNSPY